MAISANAQRRLSIALGDPAASKAICDAVDNGSTGWSYVSSYLVGASTARGVSSKAVIVDAGGEVNNLTLNQPVLKNASAEAPTLTDTKLKSGSNHAFLELAYTSDNMTDVVYISTKTSKVVTATTRGAAAHALRVTVGNTSYKLLLYGD